MAFQSVGDYFSFMLLFQSLVSWGRTYKNIFNDCFVCGILQVDIASDGLVDWDEFCTYLMLQFEENDQASKVKTNTFVPKPNIVKIDHNKV